MTDNVLCISLLALLVFFTASLLRKQTDNPKRLPLPPGPAKYPVIGNLFDIPDDVPWETFSSMAQKYVHLKILSQHTIVISSMEAASDLFEKRHAIYSDRFQSVMLTELMDASWLFGLMNYGNVWRKIRKVFHRYYGAGIIQQYDALRFDIIRTFLKRLHAHPDKFFDHSHLVFAALLMNITYGVRIEDESNEHVVEAEAGQQGFNQAIQPGRFWVDYLHILKYVPAWIPGANFKRLASQWRQHMYHARDRPFDEAKASLMLGTVTPSIVTHALENIANSPDRDEQELMIRYSLGGAFGAGVETSTSTLECFFYAMLTHPDVQKKAQAELDRVVGPSRLPITSDLPNLPYVEAILKELLRWRPVTPLALPHYTATSDEYRGYYIPKGSIVLANVWQILRNPLRYPCPDQFRPERFLKSDGSLNPDISDPSIACFGFGRRICPGSSFGVSSLFSTIACVLHTFDIAPPLDEDGKPVVVELHMHSGMIAHPKQFPCTIQSNL
ncbi:unnamed protein product [Somion occarium]|uniref:Cytochrome P450 n=1 Tax=Somion occarium TaxID=3059160 RepID=A0ABP1D5N6_9APHY